MKLLVVGAAGQIGREVVEIAATDRHDVVALDRLQLDITDRDAVLDTVRSIAPDVVLNAAAFTAVDRCETEAQTAFAVNADAVGHLREASTDANAHLVTISTDYVFDGTKPTPYLETDEPSPQSVYGRSKLAGELHAGDEATIVRTSWVFGQHGSNIVKTLARALQSEGTLQFVHDQRGCPTSARDLAAVLVRLAVERRSGLVHATNAGPVSWFEFARDVAVRLGRDPERVVACSTADLVPARPAPRPANSVLANQALADAGYAPMRHHREALSDLLATVAW